jgi:hypothetical protein
MLIIHHNPWNIGVFRAKSLSLNCDCVLEVITLFSFRTGADCLCEFCCRAVVEILLEVRTFVSLGVSFDADEECLLGENVGDVFEGAGLDGVSKALMRAMLAGKFPSF